MLKGRRQLPKMLAIDVTGGARPRTGLAFGLCGSSLRLCGPGLYIARTARHSWTLFKCSVESFADVNVVDISLDDTEDEALQDTQDPDIDLNLLVQQFPWQAQLFEENDLPLKHLENLASWFALWLAKTETRPEIWQHVYSEHHDAFLGFSQIISKFLTSRRYGFARAFTCVS